MDTLLNQIHEARGPLWLYVTVIGITAALLILTSWWGGRPL